MKRKMISLSAAFIVFFLAGSANASYFYIGTDYSVNNDKPKYVADYLISEDYILGEDGLSKEEGAFSYTVADDGLSGTWKSDGSVDFITIKASNAYAAYQITGLESGVWSTVKIENGGGQQPELSHMTAWSSPGYTGGHSGGGGSSAVPEPTTMALLFGGLGILGYNKFRSKFGRKKE